MRNVNDVRYSHDAKNFIKRAEPKIKDAIKKIIESLKSYPPEGDIKPLQGYDDGRMRYRKGKYRIIFRYDEEGNLFILSILDIGARGDIYK